MPRIRPRGRRFAGEAGTRCRGGILQTVRPPARPPETAGAARKSAAGRIPGAFCTLRALRGFFSLKLYRLCPARAAGALPIFSIIY
jgi:hypothetical protein